MAVSTCVFDAYGTLLDVGAAAREYAVEASAAPGLAPDAPERDAARWPALAETWRAKQLEYTWLRSLAQRHADFQQVTEEALDYALEAHGLDAARHFRPLMALYERLAAYPDARPALEALRANGVRQLAILSNGTPKMLGAAVERAGVGDLLDAVLSAEEVGVYKPDARIYDLVGARFGAEPSAVVFVSSNGWDAAGAAGYGFRAVWVNRRNAPVDRLYARPERQLADLTQLPAVVAEMNQAPPKDEATG